MTDDEIVYETFYNLRYHYENEVVEFKKVKNIFSFDDLGKYFSSLSNEENKRDRDFAWLVKIQICVVSLHCIQQKTSIMKMN